MSPPQIAIEIIDTNNKVPFADTYSFNQTVYVWENATNGTEIVTLFSIDLDRDGTTTFSYVWKMQ